MTASQYLYPRLPFDVARDLHQSTRDLDPVALAATGALSHESQVFAATGGSRVDEERLFAIQEGIRHIAREAGWPSSPTVQQRLDFDALGAQFLVSELGIVGADAGSDGVWMFMTMVLAPEVAPWRWPSWNERRFLNHPRNTFRSMYWRGYVLGYPILTDFGEDEIVAVIERPSLSANPVFARTIFRVLAPARKRLSKSQPMEVMRDFAKRIRRITPFLSVDALTETQMEELLEELLLSTLSAFGENAADLLQVAGNEDVPTPVDLIQSTLEVGKPRYTPRRNTSRFSPVWQALVEHSDPVWRLTIPEVESILGFSLPTAYRRDSSAWDVRGGTELVLAINDAGWEIRDLNRDGDVLELFRSTEH